MLKIPLVNGNKLCLNPNSSPIKNSKNNTITQLINANSKKHCALLCFKIIEYAFANKNTNVSVKDMKNHLCEIYNKYPDAFLKEQNKEPFKSELSLKQTIGNYLKYYKNIFTKSDTDGKTTFCVKMNSHLINYLKDILDSNKDIKGLKSEEKQNKKEFIKKKRRRDHSFNKSNKTYITDNSENEERSSDFDDTFYSEEYENNIHLINENINTNEIIKNENGENKMTFFVKKCKEEIQFVYDDVNKCQSVLSSFKNKLEELMKNIKKLEMLYNRYKKKKNNISFSIKELNEHYNLLKGAFILSSNDKKNKVEENDKNKNTIENSESSHCKIIDFKSCKTYTSLKINNLMNDLKDLNALFQEIISVNNKICSDKLSLEKKDCAIKDNVIKMYNNLLKKISKEKVNLVNDNHDINPEKIEELKEKFKSLFDKYKDLLI